MLRWKSFYGSNSETESRNLILIPLMLSFFEISVFFYSNSQKKFYRGTGMKSHEVNQR